jgi:hypothetical protein
MTEFVEPEKLILGVNWWPSPCVDCGALAKRNQSHTRCIRCHRINAAVKKCEEECGLLINRMIRDDEQIRRREARAALSEKDYEIWLKADKLRKRAAALHTSANSATLTDST